MRKTVFAKIIKTFVVIMALNFMGGHAMAHAGIRPGQETVSVQDGDFEKLKEKLATFKAKVQESSKADASDLFAEAKAIKAEINAASLTDEEKGELAKTFNEIIEIAKNLK